MAIFPTSFLWRRMWKTRSLYINPVLDCLYFLLQLGICPQLVPNFSTRMDRGSMVSAPELIPNGGVRTCEFGTHKVHGDLPRLHVIFFPGTGQEVPLLNVVEF